MCILKSKPLNATKREPAIDNPIPLEPEKFLWILVWV